MKQTIFLNAGHSELEPGALSLYGVERDLNTSIRDELLPELKRQGFKIKMVPDNLDFRESYKWVNKNSLLISDGLALDIHCNKGGRTGAESYYYAGSVSSKEIAKELVDVYSKEMKMKNRGPKPDTQSQPGEISWIRKTNVWATLIECGYMDSKEDMDLIIGHFDQVAIAICKGVCAIYDIPYIEKSPQLKVKSREEMKEEIHKLVDQL